MNLTLKKPEKAQQSSLSSHIAHIAGVLSSNEFPTGRRAELKRIVPGEPLPLAFYAFAVRHLPENWEKAPEDWATVVAGMALMAPTVYSHNTGLGDALAQAKFSEARLERLLAAEGETLRTLFLRAVRLLASKSIPFNWTDGAKLLFYKDQKAREDFKLHMARDFYSNIKES